MSTKVAVGVALGQSLFLSTNVSNSLNERQLLRSIDFLKRSKQFS
jgi:hypothetical protein